MRFGKAVFLLVLMVCGAALAFGQPAQRAPIIAGITVDGLANGEDAETVVAYSGLRIGQEAKPDDLVNAIRSLWNRHTFSDVQIIKERETALGVFLIIKVKPAPRLRNLIVEGNDEVSISDVLKAIDKRTGDIISAYDEYEVRLRVKNLYRKEGMLFARVQSTLLPTDSLNAYDLRVTIDEGAEYSVAAIEFEGNVRFTAEELTKAFTETKTTEWYEFWASDDFDADKYEADKKLLEKWFLEQGLLDAEILGDTVIYDDVNQTVALRVRIHEGPQVYVRSVTFEGNTVYPTEILKARLGILPGQLYNGTTIGQNLTMNETQTDVASLYNDNGYLSIRLEPDLRRVAEDSVDIVIRVLEGDRFTIRKISIAGNTKTRDRVIRRELFTRPGDYFNRAAIIRSLKGLGMLNYFNPENLQPQVVPASDKTSVDVVYTVEERSTDTFNASIGFAGVFGLTGSVGITLNNFDITEPLRGGAGQILAFQWEFGQASRLQTFQLSFTEPWLFGEPTTVGFNIFDTRQNFNINIRRTGAQLNVGRRFRFPDDFFRGDWSLAFERIESNTASIFSRAGVNTALTVGQTISRTSFDNMIFPTSGSRFSVGVRATTGFLGIGSTDFGKLNINFDIVNPLLNINGNPRLVLYVGSQLGYVDGFKNDTTIPPQELFYMGGNGLGGFALTPLRGYRDNSIGPLSPNGQNLGGRMMARFFAEFRFALSLNPIPIYLLSFAEAGNVWANIRTVDPFTLNRAAGVGLRLLLNPIGLIGFDVGYGFDPDPLTGVTSGWQFHFQFGR